MQIQHQDITLVTVIQKHVSEQRLKDIQNEKKIEEIIDKNQEEINRLRAEYEGKIEVLEELHREQTRQMVVEKENALQ